MRRIAAKEVMTAPVVSILPADTIPKAVRLMRKRGISGLPVVDDGELVGVISEADILLKEAGVGGLPELAYLDRSVVPQRKGSTVGELMTRHVITATEETSVHDVAVRMNRHGINRIPIVRDRTLVGIITRADVIALFDRPPLDLLGDVRRTLRDGLLLDPDRFEIIVKDGIASLRGVVDDPHAIGLIETFLAEIDGLSGVDTTGLRTSTVVGAPHDGSIR